MSDEYEMAMDHLKDQAERLEEPSDKDLALTESRWPCSPLTRAHRQVQSSQI